MMENNNGLNRNDSTLFGSDQQNNQKQPKKKNSAKKQQTAIIALAAVVVVSLALYFLVVSPYLSRDNEADEPIELIDGEALGTNDTILLYDRVEKEDIYKIEVNNEKGGYGFFYNGISKEFFVMGNTSAPYDTTLFSSLTSSVGQMKATERLLSECDDYSEYGLDEAQNPASYTLTTQSGEVHTVYIGDKTPTGQGYYARHADRSAVYIVGTSIGKTVFSSLEDMITPILTLPMEQNDYFMIDKFTLMRGKDIALQITYLDEEEQKAAAAITAYKMLAPANYSVNSTNYITALESLMNFVGKSTLVYKPTTEQLSEYGISEAAFSIHYTYGGIDQSVIFSEKNENGNYYAYSLLFDLITEVDGEKLAWLEWDTVKWIDYPVFMMNINDIKSIKIESDTAIYNFKLDGVDKELTVTEQKSGTARDVSLFRKFYHVLLTIHMQDYVYEDLDTEAIETLVAGDNLYLTLTIETRAGQTTVYKFYPYSTRRAYYTVNGEGEFYVLRDKVTKVITDAEKLMAGEVIDPEAHS